MISFNEPTFNRLYKRLYKMFDNELLYIETSPRGKPTREIVGPIAWTISDPWRCWLTIPGRKLNPFFAAAEIFWILGGDGNVDWISRFNKNMLKFADPGKSTFNAAYGNRIFKYQTAVPEVNGQWVKYICNQVSMVVKRLLDDCDTRRAAICLWHPVYDNRDSLDVSCNNLIYFKIRDNELHTTVCQRSNDLIWGCPYNMLQFQHLAMLVIGELEKFNIPLSRGTHTVLVNSLHVYTDLYRKTLDSLDKTMSDEVDFSVNDGDLFMNKDYVRGITSYWIQDLKEWIDTCKPDLDGWTTLIKNPGLMGSYWIELAAMAAMYLRKDIIPRDELLLWCEENLHPVLNWMVSDFWNKNAK